MNNLQWTEPGNAVQAPNIRIILLDALRGFAVLGIYWINIVVFSLDSDAYITTVSSLPPMATDIMSGPMSDVLVEGTMRGLFSMLFGASAMVFLSEAKLAAHGLEVVDRYYRRTLLLILFGVLHAYFLLWPYDVLYVYGVFGMFLFPLRKISPKVLIIIGLIVLHYGDVEIGIPFSNVKPVDMAISSTEDDSVITTAAPANNSNASAGSTVNTPATNTPVDPETVQHRTYLQIFQQNIESVVDEQSNKLYTSYLYDVGGMMIIGMALLKLGIISGKRSRRFYLAFMLGGYLVGFVARDSDIYHYLLSTQHFLDDTDDALLGYNLGRLLVSLGHVGLIALLISFNVFNILSRLLIAVGRLALTNYIMQTIISVLIFHIFGFELLPGFDRANLVYICISVWIFQIIFSVTWLHFFKLGPLEWMWRSLIYGKAQPLRRQHAVAPLE